MLFTSIKFVIFLAVVFALYWLLPHKYRWIILLVSSYYFYMCWNAKYVFLILFTTAVSYFAAIFIEKCENNKQKKLVLVLSLVACLGVLFVFKYLGYFFDLVTQLASLFTIRLQPLTLKILLPVGISFYTFQTLSYVIDVYRGDAAEHHFGYYAAYVSFFPQLVAGPIERASNFLPQLKEEHTFDYDTAVTGCKLMLVGFFKKMVIADNLATHVDLVFGDITSQSGLVLIIAIVAFSIQIYCDFSGYTDIARGTANLFGLRLMENFKSPFFSSSVSELWERWHISLSTWFRDYVYIPLGGSRCSKAKQYRNLLLTFLASGLWHGANTTFVVWGGVHGLACCAERALKLKRPEKGSAAWFLRVLLTFIIFNIALVFFRCQTLGEAGYFFTHMFTGLSDPHMYLRNGILDFGSNKLRFLLYGALYVLPLAFYDYLSLDHDVLAWVGKQKAVWRHAIYISVILLIVLFHAYGQVSFVYFQF